MIVGRRKNGEKSVVQHHDGEPDDRAREPIEKVLQQLNGDGVWQVRFLIDGGHVEVGDVSEPEGLFSGGRVFFLDEDGEETFVEGNEGEPEHGGGEEVEEVLELKLHHAVGRKDGGVNLGHVVRWHVGQESRLVLWLIVCDVIGMWLIDCDVIGMFLFVSFFIGLWLFV